MGTNSSKLEKAIKELESKMNKTHSMLISMRDEPGSREKLYSIFMIILKSINIQIKDLMETSGIDFVGHSSSVIRDSRDFFSKFENKFEKKNEVKSMEMSEFVKMVNDILKEINRIGDNLNIARSNNLQGTSEQINKAKNPILFLN